MWYVCFSFSFWQKGEDGGIDAEKTGHCIKSPSAMYVVEVLPLHQERKFLHYCWAARRRTFTKNLLFSAALLYLDTGGQCSHSWHHQAWQVTRVLPTAISDSVLSCQWGFSFSVVCFCVCSLVCVCAPDFSASSDRHRTNFGPLGIAVGDAWKPLGVPTVT